jgi:hypothetical protein
MATEKMSGTGLMFWIIVGQFCMQLIMVDLVKSTTSEVVPTMKKPIYKLWNSFAIVWMSSDMIRLGHPES